MPGPALASLQDTVSQTHSTVTDTVTQATDQAQTLTDPLMQLQQVTPPYQALGKQGKKAGMSLFRGLTKLREGHKKRKGKETVYAEEDDGTVTKTKRGKDGVPANGLRRKVGQMEREKGWRKLAKGTIQGAAIGRMVGSLDPVTGGAGPADWVDPMADITDLAKNTLRTDEGVVYGARHQHGYDRARTQQKDLEAQGDLLSYGFQGAKKHFADSRDNDVVKAANGAIGATGAGISLAGVADPTQVLGRFGGRALKLLGKHGKKLEKSWKYAKEDRLDDKLRKAQNKAEAGDPKAMRYLMTHDPRLASGQMLMHAQDETRSDDERSETIDRIAHVMRFGDDAKEEMKTGKLSEFDPLYALRTGRKMDVGVHGLDKATAERRPPAHALTIGLAAPSRPGGPARIGRPGRRDRHDTAPYSASASRRACTTACTSTTEVRSGTAGSPVTRQSS